MSHFRAQSQEGLGTVCNWCIMVCALDGDRWGKVRADDSSGQKIEKKRKIVRPKNGLSGSIGKKVLMLFWFVLFIIIIKAPL